jgi:MOSC domain-containing protein YiiM
MNSQIASDGVITNLFLKPAHGEPMQSVDLLYAVADKGLQGDQSFGRRSRQVLLVDFEQISVLKLQPGDLRENITMEGLAIDSLPPGTRLQSGEVILKIVDVCTPCEKLEGIRPGLMEAAEGVRGMLAVVEKSGVLSTGTTIKRCE